MGPRPRYDAPQPTGVAMNRRSRAGGEPIKGRRPKTPEPTHRTAPKVQIRSKPSPVAEEHEVTRLARERDEALEQKTATSEVLRVISASPGELEPVFQAMLERAVCICGAKFGNIYRWDGEALHILASHNTPPAFAEAVRRSPYRPYPHSPIGRMVAKGAVAHIKDVTAEEVYTAQHDPVAVSAVALGGIRTLLGVPLLNKGQMIGAFFCPARKFVSSPTSRLSLSRTSPPRRLSLLRTHGCSMNCVNRCSSRRRPPTCSKLSAVRPSTCSRCWTRWLRPQRSSARPIWPASQLATVKFTG